MKRKARVAAVVVAGGLLTGGAVAVAGPAVAGAGPFGQPAAGTAWTGGGHGPGVGMGAGAGNGVMGRGGTCLTTAPSGTLSQQQKGTLAAMAEEEKLASDLYRA